MEGGCECRRRGAPDAARSDPARDGGPDVQSEQERVRGNAVLRGPDRAVVRAEWGRRAWLRGRRGGDWALFVEQHAVLPAVLGSLSDRHHSGRNGFQSPAAADRFGGDAHEGPHARVQERAHARQALPQPLSRAGAGISPDRDGAAGDDERRAVDRVYFGALLRRRGDRAGDHSQERVADDDPGQIVANAIRCDADRADGAMSECVQSARGDHSLFRDGSRDSLLGELWDCGIGR